MQLLNSTSTIITYHISLIIPGNQQYIYTLINELKISIKKRSSASSVCVIGMYNNNTTHKTTD